MSWGRYIKFVYLGMRTYYVAEHKARDGVHTGLGATFVRMLGTIGGWRGRGLSGGAFLFLLALFSLSFLAGCAVQLSPAYDDATFKSITDLNVKTETLFAALSRGGTAADFPTYKMTYDQLLGGFAAARMATSAREIPPINRPLFGKTPLKTACGDDPTDCINPTPHHLDEVIALLGAMRDAHQHGQLVGELVVGLSGQAGFKGQYEIEMNRVLIFEAALQR